jgi:hypothetical protein
MIEDQDNTIGYKKPPKTSQFQKGRSGNPSGRPKKNPGIADVFRKVTRQVVRTNGQNGQQNMTKLEATVTQLVNKAANGDLKAMRIFILMASRFPELVKDPDAPITLVVKPVWANTSG